MLTADRNTPYRVSQRYVFPVKAGAKIFAGALVVLDAGFAAPGRTALNLVAVGRAEEFIDNTAGLDGDKTITVYRDAAFRFANSGGADAITLADVGKDAFIVDDETVAKTNGVNTRSLAGVIRDVDAAGVWIEV